MIKQITDFSREEARGSATIEVFMMVPDPKDHLEAIKALIEDGAIIQSVDADTIRATFKACSQDKLLELIEDGWSFEGQDVPEGGQ